MGMLSKGFLSNFALDAEGNEYAREEEVHSLLGATDSAGSRLSESDLFIQFLGGLERGVCMNSRKKGLSVPRRTPRPGPGKGMPRRGSPGLSTTSIGTPRLIAAEAAAIRTESLLK